MRSFALVLVLVLATACQASRQPTGTVRNEGGNPASPPAIGGYE